GDGRQLGCCRRVMRPADGKPAQLSIMHHRQRRNHRRQHDLRLVASDRIDGSRATFGNDEDAPFRPFVDRCGAGELGRKRSSATATLIVAIDNLWWPVSITVSCVWKVGPDEVRK